MPTMTPGLARPRQDLAQHLEEFAQDESVYIADQIFADLPVSKKRGVIWRIPAKSSARLVETQTAPGAAAPRGRITLDDQPYLVQTHKHETTYDDETEADFADVISFERTAAALSRHVILRAREKRAADLTVRNSADFPLTGNTGLAVDTPWDDPDGATPAADLVHGIDAIRRQTGVTGFGMHLQIPYYLHRQLSLAKDVRDALKIDSKEFPGAVPTESLATYFGVGRVIVAGAMYDADDQGVATEDLVDIWPDDHAFLFIPGGGGLERPQLGRTMVWTEYGRKMSVDVYRDEEHESDVLRVKQSVQELLFGTRFGFRFGGLKDS